jgi:hypothetical protein
MRIGALILLGLVALTDPGRAQHSQVSSSFRIARLKYTGGGDWYNDPSAEVNLLNFIRKNTDVDADARYEYVEIASENFFSYPLVFITGHGNIAFSNSDVSRLRTYLENGGFLYADDDYGMDKAFRREMKKIFPGQEFVELPFSHGIYNCQFDFPNGPPKIHQHNEKPAQGFGLFHNGRLVVYYTYESNPSDGWADPQAHNDPESKRLDALKFGTNIVVWALTH